MPVIDKGPLVEPPLAEPPMPNVQVAFVTDATKLAGYQAACQQFAGAITIQCAPYPATIPDPNFVPDPKNPDAPPPQIPNTQSLQDYAQGYVRQLINGIILGNANAQGDAVVTAQAAIDAANRQAAHDAITNPAQALVALPITVNITQL